MNIFDLDKNSLPEQVQINKENIAALMADPTTKQYVDEQDAATLQTAKDYADNADGIVLRYIRNNYVYLLSVISPFLDTLTYDVDDLVAYRADSDSPYMFYRCHTAVTIAGNWTGITNWEQVKLQDLLALKQKQLTTASVPDGTLDKSIGFDSNGDLVKGAAGSTTVTAADIDSETATAGQVLQADGNGGASWQNAGGSETLIWSGSSSCTDQNVIPFNSLLTNGKIYRIVYTSSDSKGDFIAYIQKSENYPSLTIINPTSGSISITTTLLNWGQGKYRSLTNLIIATGGNTTGSLNIIINYVYEV